MMQYWIGLDNGVTGSIGIIGSNGDTFYFPVPIKVEQDYTKKKQNITRLVFWEFYSIFLNISPFDRCSVIIEIPMVNPGRFKKSISAVRCLESQLVCFEILNISREFISSRDWQKEMLPKGCKKEQLKKASLDIGVRLFPQLEDEIRKQKDADGLLIAEWARRNNL